MVPHSLVYPHPHPPLPPSALLPSDVIRGIQLRPNPKQRRTRRPSRILELPRELLLEIFEHIHFNSARSLPLVCRAWRSLGNTALYADVEVRNELSIPNFLRTLRGSRLGSLVHKARLGGAPGERDMSGGISKWISAVRSWVLDVPTTWDVILPIIIKKCPNLRELAFDLQYGASVKTIPQKLQRDSLAHISRIEVREPQAKLWRSSSERDHATPPHWLVESLATGSVNVRSLEVLIIERSRASSLLADPKWTSFPRLRTLWLEDLDISGGALSKLMERAGSTLVELTLIRVRVAYTSPVRWSKSIPNLRLLRVLQVQFPSPADIAKLLGPCAGTLQELHLHLHEFDETRRQIPWEPLRNLLRIEELVVCGNYAAVVPLIRIVAPTLKHLELTGNRESGQLPVAETTETLSFLMYTLSSLTLRNYSFFQHEINRALVAMRAITVVTLHTPAPYDFHHHLPRGVEEVRFVGNAPTDTTCLPILRMLALDKSTFAPSLARISIDGDESYDSRIHTALLRRLCGTHDIALTVYIVDRHLSQTLHKNGTRR